MPTFTQYMDPEERDQWASILDAALNGSRQADQAAVNRLEAAMAKASRTGSKWPAIVYRHWQREGMRVALKSHAKAQSIVLVAWNGAVVSKSSRRGVLVTADDGSRVWQQKLFVEMTWEELDQYRRHNAEQIASLQINEVMAQKLDALRVLAPGSTGPQDAATRLGTSIETVLAS